MLTYDLSDVKGSLYQYLYECIKADILKGKLVSNEKMPSKRSLAGNLGVSTITIENAYDQLISEGYMYSIPKRGYYVAEIEHFRNVSKPAKCDYNILVPQKETDARFDFSSNRTETNNFPFSVWARVMRETISYREKELMEVSPCCGVLELRTAIANHLSSFRGMVVDPNQIVIGAGTEYLYSLLIKLLGNKRIYCIENPGYKKIKQIYESNNAICKYARMDENGIIIDDLRKANGDIAHISPTHHFPTGITMPVSRRYELLAWANESADRYIIEDDYDSEFRLTGKPIPTLQSIDACGKVIYMNTFSKSLTSSIRISYMVLPEKLANEFYERLSFYSCTVSTFEQYTLARFMSGGYFEKHINRMRIYYKKKRAKVLEIINKVFDKKECHVIENDSGLHFVLQINTKVSDKVIKERLQREKIKIVCVTEYEMGEVIEDKHQFILNYSNMDVDNLEEALIRLKEAADL